MNTGIDKGIPRHGWGDEVRYCACEACGKPMTAIFDHAIRMSHDDCGGYARSSWADRWKIYLEERKTFRRTRGI